MTRWRWARPERHASLPSTNTLALEDPRPGRVVVADHQTHGQGRRGRTWSSPPGRGMAISAVVPAPPPRVVGWVPLAAGVAVVRALAESRWPVEATLKWPNDVLLEAGPRPGKLSGILAVGGQAADGRAVVVVGTGLNVDHTAEELPVPTATSWRLARGGAPLADGAREDLLEAYLRHLADLTDHLLEGDGGPVRAAYLAVCGTLGREVAVHHPDGRTTTGRAEGLDEGGALQVSGPGGRTVHHAGDVEHLRPR